VREKMEQLEIGCIYNAAYSPDYNPIESVFSVVKNAIKRERIRQFAKGSKKSIEEIINESFKL
jgi:transposase